MDTYCDIVFFDSGVGGLPYLTHFIEGCKTKNIFAACAYIADNKNFPYGTKTKAEVSKIVSGVVERAKKIFSPKIIVLACNTASVSALKDLRLNFADIEFVGTVPALRPAILNSKTNNIGLLGTERTVEDAYIKKLASDINPACVLHAIAATDLVDFVENKHDTADEEAKIKIVQKYVDILKEKNIDGIVLGCTHFLFMEEIFKRIAEPDIRIFDSLEGVCKRAISLLQQRGLGNLDTAKRRKNIFAATKDDGQNEQWKKRTSSLDMEWMVI
ncbi:MAG: glutamate racemase [Termitinemataceae bacterium]|nr:MAG: glutamate racemase [Termitinemataceae bacterium]